MKIYLLSQLSFTAFVLEVAIGLFLVARNPRSQLNRLSLLVALAFAVWSFGYAYLYLATNESDALFWYRISSIGWIPMAAVGLHLISVLTGLIKKTLRKLVIIAGYLIAAIMLVRSWTGVIYAERFEWHDGMIIERGATDSPWFWIFVIYTLSYSMLVVITLIQSIIRTRKSGEKKRYYQAVIILASFVVMSIFAFSINIFAVILDLQMPVFGHLSFLIFIAGIWFSVARYELITISSEIASSAIISSMADLMFLLDAHGRVIQTNERAHDSFSITPLMPITHLIRQPDSQKILNGMFNHDQAFSSHELRLLTRDGGILPVKAVISAIYDSFDDLLGYSLVAHDITEKLALADKNRIIEEQLVFAQRIQLNLMPPARESVPGPFRISSHYQPMEALGGDFYDLIHFSDESSLGIFVSDVSGHGVPAALITSMVKALLTTAGEVRNFPEKMMEYLNHMLMGNMESNFLTAVYGLIESERKTITVARAGHPPAYIIRSDSIEIIAPRGPLLGLMQGDFWKHQTYRFEPGDIYLSFTDGLSEALDQNGQIFEDLLMDILSQRAYCNADELIQVLTDRLNTFTGKRNKQDDKLIVAVEYSPSI